MDSYLSSHFDKIMWHVCQNFTKIGSFKKCVDFFLFFPTSLSTPQVFLTKSVLVPFHIVKGIFPLLSFLLPEKNARDTASPVLNFDFN